MASQSDRDLRDAEAYQALLEKNEQKVLDLCDKFEVGPFNRVTIHEDSILHVALLSTQVSLVLKLLKKLRPQDLDKIRFKKNRAGNAILHEAATSDKLVEAAKEILRLSPDSLSDLTGYKETALYRSVRYGQINMFEFLDEEVNKKYCGIEDVNHVTVMKFYQNKEFTILHQAVVNGHYELALRIATKHPELIDIRDKYDLTALHHLARNPSPFEHKCLHLKCSSGDPNDKRTVVDIHEEVKVEASCCFSCGTTKKKMKDYETAVALATLLIKYDTTWKKTGAFGDEKRVEREADEDEVKTVEGDINKEDVKKKRIGNKHKLTPLFLATKYGIIEIVKGILEVYPQAVEHIDEHGRTILHIAIQYNQIEVFNMVEEMDVPMRRLIKKTNKDSNSILHMVGLGLKNAVQANEEKSESPAILLQKSLQLYERVDVLCSVHFFNHLNKVGQTAWEVFVESSKDLRNKSQDWLKNTAQSCTVVAGLIATVAFTAAYTVPGGSKSDTGTPVLLNQTFFIIFAISDVISLTFTLMAIIFFLLILTSPFRLRDFKDTLIPNLVLGVMFLISSVTMMMLAFAATIILMIRNGQEWKKVTLYAVAFLPVSIFTYSYMKLFWSLVDSTLDKHKLRQIKGFFKAKKLN